MDDRLLAQPCGGAGPKSDEVLPELADDLDVIASLGLTVEAWEALPDTERRWWQNRHRRKGETHSCGHAHEVCSDATREWFPQLEVCYPERERLAALARFEALHKDKPWHDGEFKSWSAEQDRDHPYHHSHGTTIWASPTDLGHGGDFLRTGSGSSNEPPDGHREADDPENDGGSLSGA